MSSQPKPNPRFTALRDGLEQPVKPGYLDYWKDREAEGDDALRVSKIVKGLTAVAIRGELGTAEYTDREPALQARYWYRALGPLNPMTDIEYDLERATEMMHGRWNLVDKERANLRLDMIYSLEDFALVSQSPNRRIAALRIAINEILALRGANGFERQEPTYRIQSHILENDLKQLYIRNQVLGDIKPARASVDKYRSYEESYAKEEIRAIDQFAELLNQGITEENFGIMFEWYFILAERYEAWSDERLDTTVIRGATSRENAEWTGEDEVNVLRVKANYDVIVTSAARNGGVKNTRFQLKTVKSPHIRYDPAITVLDFNDVLEERFRSIDSATSTLKQLLRRMRKDYTESYPQL